MTDFHVLVRMELAPPNHLFKSIEIDLYFAHCVQEFAGLCIQELLYSPLIDYKGFKRRDGGPEPILRLWKY